MGCFKEKIVMLRGKKKKSERYEELSRYDQDGVVFYGGGRKEKWHLTKKCHCVMRIESKRSHEKKSWFESHTHKKKVTLYTDNETKNYEKNIKTLRIKL